MNGTAMAPATARAAQPRLPQLLLRIRAEYDEMPGLCLTRTQAQRLWGLDADVCDAVLAALVDVKFLKLTSSGYMRS